MAAYCGADTVASVMSKAPTHEQESARNTQNVEVFYFELRNTWKHQKLMTKAIKGFLRPPLTGYFSKKKRERD